MRAWIVVAVFLSSFLGRAEITESAEDPPILAPQGLGQLLVPDAQSDSPVRLNVARYHVNVVLQPPVALVQIDQSFYNPYGSEREGQFVFNLPQGASVSRFAMYVTPTELIEGELIERQQASSIYQSIVSRRRDPAILEQIGDNLFKMRVFPVFARDEKRILLDYTLPMDLRDGQYGFRLPLLSDLQPIWDFRISGTIRGAVQPQSVRCVSHPELAVEERADGSISLEFQRQNYQPETDLVLSFSQTEDRPASVRCYQAEPLRLDRTTDDRWSSNGGTYFLAEIPPDQDVPEAPPADFLIVADTSSSIQDLAAVRQMIREIARALRSQDRVRLVCADVGVRPLHEGWLNGGQRGAASASSKKRDAEPETAKGQEFRDRRLAKALETLEQEFCLGRTDLDTSLQTAVQTFEDADEPRRRVVIYVGDGADAVLDELWSTARESLPEWVRLDRTTFVGIAVQRGNPKGDALRAIVKSAGGLWFDLAGDIRARHELAQWLKDGLPAPQVIRQVTVEGADPEDLYCPMVRLPNRPLYVYGRLDDGGLVKLTLKLERNQQTKTHQWTLKPSKNQDDVFVGRLWAQRRLAELRGSEGDDQEKRKQIVALSQEWSLLSPHTAFLVLETEADYNRWRIQRIARRRYWKPAEALTSEPLPPDWLAAVKPPEQSKTTKEQFQQALDRARQAVAAGDHARARSLLRSVEDFPPDVPAAMSDEYTELERQALDGLRASGQFTSQDHIRRRLDPTESQARQPLRPSVDSLLGATFRADPRFARRHPYARKLLQEVNMASLGNGRSLKQFATGLSRLTGTNVVIDERALEDVGIRTDVPVGTPIPKQSAPGTNPFGDADPFGDPEKDPFNDATLDPLADQPKDPFATVDADLVQQPARHEERSDSEHDMRLSLRSGVRHLLWPLDLVMIEEPHRLLITTPEEAEMRLTTELYPVADLVFTDRSAPLWLLDNPYLHREETTRRRIQAKLRQPITMQYHDTPLVDVVADLAGKLNDNVMCDVRALDDIGLDGDVPITASYRDVPAEVVLQWLLDDLDLTYAIWDESVVITTPEEFESRLDVRAHSGRGVLYEYPDNSPLVTPSAPFGFRGGMMGMGGSFGGGMGGFGGGGGTFGGSLGGGGAAFGVGITESATGNVGSGVAGMSSGGDGQAGSDSDSVVVDDSPAFFGSREVPAIDEEEEEPSEVQYVHDDDILIDTVTNSIAPETWDMVGGPGAMQFFPNTLDFVIAQTRGVHQQVELLFNRMRAAPMELGVKQGGRPATIHAVTADDPGVPDLDTLIDLITSTIAMDTWDAVGGPGSLDGNVPRVALIVSQTEEVHDELVRLFTLLRRSRYEAEHGTRPWEAGKGRGPEAAERLINDGAEPLRTSELPPPKPEELERLQVRSDPPNSSWTWQLVQDSVPDETIRLDRDGDRIECRLPHCILRLEGELADVAWPGIGLVEHGDYAETLRRMLDRRLPWLPHRTNHELAQLFDVQVIDAPDADAAPQGDPQGDLQGDSVWLRLIPAGLTRDGGTYLQMAFDRDSRQPVAWQSYVDGERIARIEFTAPDSSQVPALMGGLVLFDASDREVARWEPVASEAEPGRIPELTRGWDRYLHLDRRGEQPVLDAPLAEALAAIERFEWAQAAERLTHLPGDQARHPLARLLQSWCQQQDAGIAPRDRVFAQLTEVAQSGAPDLLRFIAAGNFPLLTDQQLYTLLLLQPDATRTAEDLERLAYAAQANGRLPDALRHIDAAIERCQNDNERLARQPARIELLLRMGRAAETVKSVESWAAREAVTGDALADMGDLLARYGQQEPADRLFRQLLDNQELDAAGRYHYLCRWAAVRQGVARCRSLLQAAALQPVGSRLRGQCIDRLRRELSTDGHAETAGWLAAQTEDEHLATCLLIRQAELTRDAQLAAEVVWQLHKTGRLEPAQLGFACRLWNVADRSQRVIDICEGLLRAGRKLSSGATSELAIAYYDRDRRQDARRAETRDMPLQPPQQPRTQGFPVGGMF